jgi:hypothetical protein
MVPESLPLSPDVIESQLLPDVTEAVQSIVPAPVFETLNIVLPAFIAKFRLTGDTDRTGCVGVVNVGACVTLTSTSMGLPVSPVVVTQMVAVRAEVSVLAGKLQSMLPRPQSPLAPDMIESQVPPDVTAAVQCVV